MKLSSGNKNIIMAYAHVALLMVLLLGGFVILKFGPQNWLNTGAAILSFCFGTHFLFAAGKM